MNEVFLMGKVITKIDFKFIINSKINKSIAKFEIESIDKQIIQVKAYNEIADYCYKYLNKDYKVFLYGKLNGIGIDIQNIKYLSL